jgi:transketolase C-terminal domain/subunit
MAAGGAGSSVAYPLMRTTKTSLDSAGTKREFSFFACLLASITSRWALRYSSLYLRARSWMTLRFSLAA